ncbi:hypothetical protein D9M69_619810 [compost metagenome]
MRELWREAREQLGEAGVEEHVAVFGVVQDVGDLLREQARVHCVQHGLHARDAEVQLDMAVRVPGQRGHAVAGLHAQRGERIGQALGALLHLAPVAAVCAAVDQVRHDLALAVESGRVVEHAGEQQLVLLHQGLHGVS